MTRSRRRRVLLLAGVLPALLVMGYALKVVLMVQDNDGGRDSFADGRYADAGSSFADTRALNWLEQWVAPFDEGVAHHADGAYAAAIADYGTALEDVPRDEECTVRINLALAHEAVGDALRERDAEGAIESWQAGIDVLAAGDCPQNAGRGKEQAEDAAGVDKRLREKLQEEQRQRQQQGQDPPQVPPPGDRKHSEGQDPREERLERNNERGLEQRREDREHYEGDDYSRPFAW